jgi:hypothetical protein
MKFSYYYDDLMSGRREKLMTADNSSRPAKLTRIAGDW